MTQTPDFQDTSEFPQVIETSIEGTMCPRCGRHSRDESFCEHCQFELPLPTSPGQENVPEETWGPGCFSVNWPNNPDGSFLISSNLNGLRIHGIRPELWTELAADLKTRQAVVLEILPPIHVLETGGGALIFAEAWPAERYASSDTTEITIENLVTETLVWCRKLATAMDALHQSGHVWLDFDPEAVEFRGNHVRITNLDWRLFPAGKCPSHLAKISKRFSPPEVCQFRDDQVGPQTDVFHLALAAYYRLAGLERHGFSDLGLEAFGFDFPPLRIYRPELPTGIWPALSQALSKNASQRHASPLELIQQLERAAGDHLRSHYLPSAAPPTPSEERNVLQRLFGRKKSPPPVEVFDPIVPSTTLEIGWQCETGRAKLSAGTVNQDQAVVHTIPVHQSEIQLLIVADGVTHSRVGSGERASKLGCDTLVATVREQILGLAPLAKPDWNTILEIACQSASQAIVNNALSIPDRPEVVHDNDLMSSTALVALIDGRDLYLANVGDSRAYLISQGRAEQLTVDGDVATSLLREGVPPEQVQEMGAAGKALRYCLGACRELANGQLVADLERARPQLSQWRIKPDEIYVLCSDGLVEERVFLNPEDLVTIAEANSSGSAQAIAEAMVESANSRQRLPSEAEPAGYGDNITCIVIRSAHGPSQVVLSGKG